MESSELGPKIRYQNDAEGGGFDMRDFDRGDRAYFYVDQSFVSMMDDLKRIAKAPEKQREEAREKLERNWQRLMGAELGQLEDILDNQLLRFKNPYPYDSRQQAMWFGNLQEAVKRARSEEWARNEQAKTWLDRVALDTSWAENSFRLAEGVGGVIDKFYDGKRMLTWVAERFRSDPTATYYQLALSGEVPGMEINKELLAGRAKEGLRERAIKYQDESCYWRIAVAAVHQIDYTDPNWQEKLLITKSRLSLAQIEFIKKIFAAPQKSGGDFVNFEGNVVPKETLNWYAMGSREEYKRRYLATMEVLLTEGALEEVDRLESESAGGGRTFDAQGLDALVKNLRAKVDARIGGWFSPDQDLDSRLAGVVVRSGLVMDLGHFAATRLAWGWDYKSEAAINEGGVEVIEKPTRERAEGATTVATDAATFANWLNFHAAADRKAWPAGMLPSISPEYRDEILTQHPPNWIPNTPELGALAQKDEVLRSALFELWADEDGFVWDPEVKKQLQEAMWYWVTSAKSDRTGESIVIPVFFPPEFSSLNFWNTISLEGAIKKGDPSVWDQLLEGNKLSELKWSKMGDQALYRWLITIQQTLRFLTVMTEPMSEANAGQFKDFFGSPGKLKELLKRVDLGVRDEKTPTPNITVGMVPFLLVLYTASQFDVLGKGAADDANWNSFALWLGAWAKEVSGMPAQRWDASGGWKNTNFSMAMLKMLKFYSKLIGRLGYSQATNETRSGRKAYNQIADVLKKQGIPLRPNIP